MKHWSNIRCLHLVLAMILFSASAQAQDNTKSDLERQTEAIKAETNRLNAELELRKAQQALSNQALEVPVPAKEPTLYSGAGKGTIDIKIPAIIQGHRAAITLAKRVALQKVLPKIQDKVTVRRMVSAGENLPQREELVPIQPPVLVLSGIDPFNATAIEKILLSFVSQLVELNADVEDFINNSQAVGLANPAAVAGGLRNLVANFGSLFEQFKVKTSFNDVDVTVSDDVYASAIAEALLEGNKDADPALLPPSEVKVVTSTLLPPPEEDTFTPLVKLQEAIATATRLSVKLKEKREAIDQEIAKTKTSLDAAKKKKKLAEIAKLQEDLDKLNVRKSKGAGFQTALDDSLLTAKDFNKNYFLNLADGKNPSGFVLLRQAQIVSKINANQGLVLVLSRGPSGGINRTIEGLFNSGTLSHAGGAIVTYFLYDKNRSLVSTGNFMGITPFRRLGDGNGDLNELPESEMFTTP